MSEEKRDPPPPEQTDHTDHAEKYVGQNAIEALKTNLGLMEVGRAVGIEASVQSMMNDISDQLLKLPPDPQENYSNWLFNIIKKIQDHRKNNPDDLTLLKRDFTELYEVFEKIKNEARQSEDK